MKTKRPKLELPIDALLPRLVEALASRPNLVLRADTGAGKTTRVPPALLDALDAGHLETGHLETGRLETGPLGDAEPGGTIVMLEPRRVAARAAARRIAAERGWTLGEEVGYQVRFERKASRRTRILVVTEGVLVQRLQRDPFLDGVAAVLFDEFHERSLDADLALAMCRRVQRDVRPGLRLVVLSATLDASPIVHFLGGADECAAIDSPGRLFPVEVEHLAQADARGVPTLVRGAVERLLAESTEGDVLVFLPGVGEIRRSKEFLEPVARETGVALQELYGDLPPERQDAVLRPSARRRVVLATNVAETSVTVDGVRHVVDSGLVRRLHFDPGLGLDRLELGRVSRASAEQRTGRAGRQAPGRCLRLWTEHDERSLPARETPEILRVDLAGSLLQLYAWGERAPESFPFFEAPDQASLERTRRLLEDLGAVESGHLTPLGRQLARLPLHPRLARLVVEGRRLDAGTGAVLAAALIAERDVVFRPVGRRPVIAATTTDSDIVDRVEALARFDASGYGETALGPVEPGRARWVLRAARQIESVASRLAAAGDHPEAASDRSADSGPTAEPEAEPGTRLRRALLAAYPDRVCLRRDVGSRRAVMVGGRGVRLATMSSVQAAPLFVAVELDAGRRGGGRPGEGGAESLVRQASAIDESWLPTDTDEVAVFDPARRRAVGRRRRLYRDLVLDEVDVDPGADAAAAVLVDAAAGDLASALPLDEPKIASFLGRLRSLAAWRPELELPTFDDEALRTLLPVLAAGRRSFDDLRRAPLFDILRGSLGHRQLDALERLAPERLEVPTGSRIRLRYDDTEPGAPPVLSVRIQELYGLDETPSVAGGRVPVLLHLLAPNQRPQQVTRDLPSFWRRVYPQVRKELAGRYPKHAWPEDPLTATPEHRPRRRR